MKPTVKRFLASRLGGISAAILGCVLMIFGIFRGEAVVVFAKAVRICMECIGIG